MFACVLIDHLPVKAEVQREPSLRGRPVVVAQSSGSHRVVLDASPDAVGVAAGMPLSEALSACAGATLLEPDPVHYRIAAPPQASPFPDCKMKSRFAMSNFSMACRTVRSSLSARSVGW